MKKTICLLFLILLSFSGCTKKSPEVTPVTTGLKFNAKFKSEEQELNCSVKIDANGNMTMKTDQIEYMFSGNSVTLTYGDISHQTELSSLPETSFTDLLYIVFGSISKSGKSVLSDGERYYISGNTEKYDYTCFLAQTGIPLEIKEKKLGITAVITSVVIT